MQNEQKPQENAQELQIHQYTQELRVVQITTTGRDAYPSSVFAGYEKDYPDNLSQEAK